MACALNANAATYYVDRSNGTDSNNGTSPTTAWKNCPGMTAYAGSGQLNPGDFVYFDSADTWIGSGNYVIQAVGGVTYFGDSWGSGTRATFMATGTLQNGVIKIFDDDPTEETVFKGFDINGNSQYTSGVALNYGPYKTKPLTGATKRIENCIIHDCSSNQSAGIYEYGIIASDDNHNYYVLNTEFINNKIYNIGRDGICLYPIWNCNTCEGGNSLIRNNEVYKTGTDPNYNYGSGILLKGWIHDVIVEYNYVHDVDGTGILIDSESDLSLASRGQNNITVRFNLVTNPGAGGISQDLIMVGLYGTKSIDIYGNILWNSGGGYAIEVFNNESDDTINMRIYNNSIYNGQTHIGNCHNAVNKLELINNIFYNASGPDLTDPSGYITAQSNNITANPRYKNVNNAPTGWKGTFGVDIEPNQDGFSLQADSLAIDYGIILGNEFINSINSVSRFSGAGWDIGAYEFATANLPPDHPKNLRIVDIN